MEPDGDSGIHLQIENLEELLKEKDNQVELARSKLNAVQAQTFTSEGTLTSLEEALADRDKQIAQLREQRDRAEKDNKEEKELHEREISDYKMKIHTLESEVRRTRLKNSGHFLFPFLPVVLVSHQCVAWERGKRSSRDGGGLWWCVVREREMAEANGPKVDYGKERPLCTLQRGYTALFPGGKTAGSFGQGLHREGQVGGQAGAVPERVRQEQGRA